MKELTNINELYLIWFLSMIDKDMGHPSRRVITKPVEAMAGGSSGEYDNEGIISVYCAILGAIVLGKLISHHISLAYSF